MIKLVDSSEYFAHLRAGWENLGVVEVGGRVMHRMRL